MFTHIRQNFGEFFGAVRILPEFDEIPLPFFIYRIPDASERIRTHPHASGRIRTRCPSSADAGRWPATAASQAGPSAAQRGPSEHVLRDADFPALLGQLIHLHPLIKI